MYNPELMTAIYWSIQTVYISRKHGVWLLHDKNANYMLEKFVMVLSPLDIHGSKVFSNNHFKFLAMNRWLCSSVVVCWTHLRLPGLNLSRDTSRNNNVHVLICYQSIITFWILFLEGVS